MAALSQFEGRLIVSPMMQVFNKNTHTRRQPRTRNPSLSSPLKSVSLSVRMYRHFDTARGDTLRNIAFYNRTPGRLVTFASHLMYDTCAVNYEFAAHLRRIERLRENCWPI